MGPEQRCQERMALPIIFAEFGAALRGTRRRVFISCEALPKRWKSCWGETDWPLSSRRRNLPWNGVLA